MHWEIEELEKALEAGDVMLAKRYLSKVKAFLWCPKCREPIRRDDPVVPYFKGFIHTGCKVLLTRERLD